MVDVSGKGGAKNVGAPVKAAPGGARRGRGVVAKPVVPAAAVPVIPEAMPAPVAPPAPVVAAVAPAIAAAAVPPVVTVAEPEPAPTAPEAEAPVAPLADAPAPINPSAAPAASLAVKEVEMNETVTSFAEKAQEQTKTAFANVGEQARTAAEKSRKVAEDLAEFGKGNVEALVESARIAAQGFETLGHDAAAFARARYDSTASMFQTLASVKSPTELLQIQAEYVRSAFDAVVKEASRSTEASLKLAGDVAKPLQNRVAVAADKFRTAA